MERFILTFVGAIIVIGTLIMWVMQPSLSVEEVEKVGMYIQALYYIQVIAVFIACMMKARFRVLFLVLAILSPLIEILWHLIYIGPLSSLATAGSPWLYFGADWSMYVIYSLIIPVGVFITAVLLRDTTASKKKNELARTVH